MISSGEPAGEGRDLSLRSYHTLPISSGPESWITVLDHLAARFPRVGREAWSARMDAGRVRWDDGVPIDARTPFRAGRRLRYEREVPSEPEPGEPIELLHVDDVICVIDKPPGVPVTPSGALVRRSALHQAARRVGNAALSPAHRIDQETAGLVLFVQQQRHRTLYQTLFAKRRVHKVYHAVGMGPGEPPAFTTVRSRIRPSGDRFRWRSEPDPNGPAESDVYRVGPGPEPKTWRFWVVPRTGRPHQIRLHLAQLGFPLLGDRLYPERGPGGPSGLHLVAVGLRFRDPLSGDWRFFCSRRRLF